MVVEDEDLIRRGIIKSINWSELGFEIIAEASNGKEALEKIENNVPHVIMTDVRMPVMDGLELAKKVNEKFKNVKIVILSGFADFEIARSAIKFHVFEYLLKPTDKKKFIDTFKRLREQLDKEDREADNALHIRKKLNEGMAKLREEFLLNLVDGEVGPINMLKDRMDYLELDLSANNFTVAVLSIDGDMKNVLNEWKNDESLLAFSYVNIIVELLDVVNCGAVVANGIREIIIIFNFKEEENKYELLNSIVKNSITYISNLLFRGDSLSISAGIGLTYPNITEVYKSYKQAKKALEGKFFKRDKQFFVYEECGNTEVSYERQWIKDYPEEANQIINDTVTGNVGKVRSSITLLFERYIGEKLSSKFIKNYCYVLFFLLNASLSEFTEQEEICGVLKTDFESQVASISTIHELREYVTGIFTQVAEQMNFFRENGGSSHRKIIDTVKEYIDKNYSRDISLEQLSKQVYLSPVYLSFLFKSVTGENYTDYLKKIRLEKAKELLRRVELKVYEVGNMVGYNDYKYFSIQFKKAYGISPTEYRDGIA